jgi:hypothetical protein
MREAHSRVTAKLKNATREVERATTPENEIPGGSGIRLSRLAFLIKKCLFV